LGKWFTGNGTTKGYKRRKERFTNTINDNLEDATAIIIQSITDAIIQDFKITSV
jgi:hypothetical protein